MPKVSQGCETNKAHTDAHPTKSEWDSAENLIDGADGEQSLSLDGRKVCNIKRVGISQAESNKATVCALPSIHLPLTREASVIVLWRKRSYFKTMRMQGRLTLHVRRLVLRLVAFFER